MSEIKLNQEMIDALQNCKDAMSFMALAKSKGVEISEEQAEKIFATLPNEEMSDEELDKVTGGCWDDILKKIGGIAGGFIKDVLGN